MTHLFSLCLACEFSLQIQSITLTNFLMQIPRNLIDTVWEKLKNVEPKNPSFVLKNPTRHIYPLFNVCNQMQFQKNPLKTFKDMFKNFDFGPKNNTFTQLWINKIIFLKKAPSF